MIRSIVCAAVAAACFALSAPVPAQAAVPVAPIAPMTKAATPTTGSLHTVAWRRRCWTTRRVRWHHGRRVVVRVRHCAPRHRSYRHHRRRHCYYHHEWVHRHHHWVRRTVRRCRWY